MAQFFYDSQIRRFLLQFARIFSNFDVEYGANEAGQGPGSTVDTPMLVDKRRPYYKTIRPMTCRQLR